MENANQQNLKDYYANWNIFIHHYFQNQFFHFMKVLPFSDFSDFK